MFVKSVGAALLGAWLCTGVAARAEELDPLAAGAAPAAQVPHSAGIRIDSSPGGFQLVSHGLWPRPAPVETGKPAIQVEASISGGDQQSPRRQMKPHASFRRAAYLPHVYAAESRFRLPSGLLDALVWTESRYNPLAVSGAGAAGLGQLMPATARDLGVVNRFDPRENLQGAARYLRQMLDKFGMVHLALAAYNAGPGAVERAGGIPRNGETPAYVSNVLAFWGFR